MSKNTALMLAAIPAIVAGSALNYFVDSGGVLGGLLTAAILIPSYRKLTNA